MQIVLVKNIEQGVERAKEILYEKVDKRTVLFLSGGKTPAPLYLQLAKEAILTPAAVGMVDERFGQPLHSESNELLLRQTRLLSYFDTTHVPFYPIVQKKKGRVEAAAAYDQTARDLFFHFPRSVAVMGIGKDAHTAGIIPNRKNFIDPLFEESEHHIFVGEYNDEKEYGERISMTFGGLSLIDFFLVFVFGREKKKALQKMLEYGSLEEAPARFFNQQASSNTVIITDQQV